jgi:Domain of unknown function (DUF4190)
MTNPSDPQQGWQQAQPGSAPPVQAPAYPLPHTAPPRAADFGALGAAHPDSYARAEMEYERLASPPTNPQVWLSELCSRIEAGSPPSAAAAQIPLDWRPLSGQAQPGSAPPMQAPPLGYYYGPPQAQQQSTPLSGQAQPGSAPPMQAPHPGYYYGPPQAQKQSTNGFAIASMVLGIVWIYWIGSILALVFGYMARKQIDESNGREGGRTMAVAGIVLGWVGVGILALIIVAGIANSGR